MVLSMDSKFILKNREIPKAVQPIVDGMTNDGEKVLFVIVGDLALNGRYAESALIFTEDSVVCYDGVPGEEKRYFYRDMEEVIAKRMYGNATLSAKMPDGKRVVFFRYTYAVAALCDAAALYINHINDGADKQEEFAIMAITFERALSVCPKCGRTLLHPGAECIMCRSKLKIVKQLSKYISPQLKTIIVCIILSLLTTMLSLIPPTITGYIVDVVFNQGTSSIPFLGSIATMFGEKAFTMLMTLIACLLFSYILQYGIGIVRSYLMRTAGDKAIADLRSDIYEKAQYLPMKFYDKTSTGSVINRISSDATTLKNFMLRITQEAVVHAFQLVGIVIIMLTLNAELALFSLIPVVFIVIATRIFSKKIYPYYRRLWRRGTAVLSTLSDTIPCIKVVKSFTGEKRQAEKFEEKNRDWLEMDLKIGKLATAFPQIISFLVTCGSLIIWGIGGYRVINSGNDGIYTAGLIVSFISYASMFYNPVTFFANLSDSFQGALASTEKILDILEAEPEHEAESHTVPDKLQGKIEFLHVGFSFDRTKKVLDDVTLTINPGEIVGIVGTTGSGKSTLVNLLMRFYNGYSGEILVDGHNIKNFDLSAYREQIGYVQQEPMMFSDTIFNNIAYSKPDATIEEVINAADIANAHGFIARQPDAYDTMLGERGVGVSGGERQRISIARAVLKSPSILIFDEATAAVDSETEHLIQEAIDRLIEGKTTLMIAHRLSTLKRANRIIVVDNGKIIENGPPEELMAMKGKYYKLVQIQSMTQDAEKMREEERL
jgi:ATP-binding cassette subfamily B protein